MNVLRARGVQSEAHIPFAGLFELLRPALPWMEQIPGPQAAALESALALRPASAQGRFAVGAATLSLLAAYAEEAPLAVLVDDAHWLDGSSADALLFAFRRLLADPVAVVLTVRAGEPSLLDGADLSTLRLQGLDRASAAELLRHQRDEPISQNLADRLHHDTGGNPLALLELGEERQRLADLPPGAPLAAGTSIAGVYLLRFRSLPQRTRDALAPGSGHRQRRGAGAGPGRADARAGPLRPDSRRGRGAYHRARFPRRIPAPARPVRHLRRFPGRTAACGAPCSGQRTARYRCRPPGLASRARFVRARRRRLVRARAGRPARIPAQRLRGLVTGIRACGPAGTRRGPAGQAPVRRGRRRLAWRPGGPGHGASGSRPACTPPLRSWRYRSSSFAATSPPAAGRSARHSRSS